jgi:hypothetical protein
VVIVSGFVFDVVVIDVLVLLNIVVEVVEVVVVVVVVVVETSFSSEFCLSFYISIEA